MAGIEFNENLYLITHLGEFPLSSHFKDYLIIYSDLNKVLG